MRFLFCSLASRGFLYPCIAIAQELRSRGHTVAFVTGLSMSGDLDDAGLERIPRGPKDGESFWVGQWGEPLAVLIQVKHIEYATHQFCPDVLIGQHLTLGPLLVRLRLGIPVALIGSATYLWPVEGDKDPVAVSDTDRLKTWRFNTMVGIYNTTRILLGLNDSSEIPGANPLLGDLFMIRSVPELEKHSNNMPKEVHFIGACLWEPLLRCPPLEEWLEDAVLAGRPVLYVHQGRFFEFPHFWAELMRLAGEMDMRVAASTAAMDCDLGQVAPHSFVRPYVPQGQVLAQTSVAVLSANATATLGALMAGVPALLIPAGGEQPDIAELCASAGSARLLHPHRITGEILHHELQILLTDPQIKTAAKQLAAAFSRVNSAKTAGDLLEDLATKKLRTASSRDTPVRV